MAWPHHELGAKLNNWGRWGSGDHSGEVWPSPVEGATIPAGSPITPVVLK